MAKRRALIIGGGRIGAGYQWAATPFVYTHADAYLALKDRVELCGFIEPDKERRDAASAKYKVPAFASFDEWGDSDVYDIDVVSVCTQPSDRQKVHDDLYQIDGLGAVWWEKPFAMKSPPFKFTNEMHPTVHNVNLWRRFDSPHQRVAERISNGRYGKVLGMSVEAKRDEATVCHFTDLALWWGVPRDKFTYLDVTTPGYVEASYRLFCEKAVVSCSEGGMQFFTFESPIRSRWFPGHDIMRGNPTDQRLTKPVFMETALENLLDAMGGNATLLGPPENAIKAEAWAEEILRP